MAAGSSDASSPLASGSAWELRATQPDGAGVQRGVLPERWQVSGPDCPPDPKFQIHEYNPDFVILRESGCSNYEKPFLYLIFGSAKVLMLDTGAGKTDVAQVVDGVIRSWLQRKGRESIPLVVAHTHAHGDHISGDSALKARPDTTVVGLKPADVQAFFGFTSWPDDIVSFDLGGRTSRGLWSSRAIESSRMFWAITSNRRGRRSSITR